MPERYRGVVNFALNYLVGGCVTIQANASFFSAMPDPDPASSVLAPDRPLEPGYVIPDLIRDRDDGIANQVLFTIMTQPLGAKPVVPLRGSLR